jgi:hypothetical protein
MICPECGSEYREGYIRCGSCEIALVPLPPPAPRSLPAPAPRAPRSFVTPREVELVKVYETGNPALVPLVESLLDDAGIEYMVKGETIPTLFGWGQYGSNINPVAGLLEFYVRDDAADEARAIVATLENPVPETFE